jgi:hypothetical protein
MSRLFGLASCGILVAALMAGMPQTASARGSHGGGHRGGGHHVTARHGGGHHRVSAHRGAQRMHSARYHRHHHRGHGNRFGSFGASKFGYGNRGGMNNGLWSNNFASRRPGMVGSSRMGAVAKAPVNTIAPTIPSAPGTTKFTKRTGK